MQIQASSEPATEFIERVATLLTEDGTHLYFDTSFLMWLTTIGPISRRQFIDWAAKFGDRVHVPIWTMHEYYQHHVRRTLAKRLSKRITAASKAANEFLAHVRPFTDQPLLSGQTEGEYREALRVAVKRLDDLLDVATSWSYQESAAEVLSWMNGRVCRSITVFNRLPLIVEEGSSRYTQNVPPGFEDRHKKDTDDRGSNRYGDLLFWKEIVTHAGRVNAQVVIVVSNDRKKDWYDRIGDAEVDVDLKRLRPRWDPVPAPHPTLAFELKARSKVNHLVLLDGLYLGALLWKKERALCERFADVAIGVTSLLGRRGDRPATPLVKKSQKRSAPATFGLNEAIGLVNATFRSADQAVTDMLTHLDADAPDRDDFLGDFTTTYLPTLNYQQAAAFARALHDRALNKAAAAETLSSSLVDRLADAEPNMAASLYVGFVVSAYTDGELPRSCPRSPMMEQLFYWQDDPALTKVIQALGIHFGKIQSPALYIPNTKNIRVQALVQHDAQKRQDPVELAQIFFDNKGLLFDGEARPELTLRARLNGDTEASVERIVRVASAYYGTPFALTDIEGGGPNELRSIPEFLAFREFDRFSDAASGELESEDPLPSPDDALGPDDEGSDANALDSDDTDPISEDEEGEGA